PARSCTHAVHCGGCNRNPVATRRERLRSRNQARRRAIEAGWTVIEILEVRAVVAGGLQPEALELARDVIGAFVVAELADTPALHGVVGELVEPRAQIV